MSNYTKESTALKIVKNGQTAHVNYKLPNHTMFYPTIHADVRKNLRNEAQMLTAIGKSLLIIGVVIMALFCMLNGYIYHSLVNGVGTAAIGLEPRTAIGTFIALGVCSFLIAGACVFLSLVLFGVAEAIRQETKKIK